MPPHALPNGIDPHHQHHRRPPQATPTAQTTTNSTTLYPHLHQDPHHPLQTPAPTSTSPSLTSSSTSNNLVVRARPEGGSVLTFAPVSLLMKIHLLLAFSGLVRCSCENSSMLGARKNFNLPGIIVDLSTLTEKDKEDILKWGIMVGRLGGGGDFGLGHFTDEALQGLSECGEPISKGKERSMVVSSGCCSSREEKRGTEEEASGPVGGFRQRWCG
ncbi:hypothetical protein Tsubulata_017708 [Turnera subulata]|uniref:Pyruvate kinase barrel domain-containing protein n=1 Tax=Turnera subulata TaxID=218843 RepID=A0A9Q0FRP3_9ROSI|nr:hypothetical protein Tsubulata_017708 [Turnera subulata]